LWLKKYAGQPLGLIVAETQALALEAVSKVKVEYSYVGHPHLNMRDIIASDYKTRIREEKELDAVKKYGKFAQIQNKVFFEMC
jgi:CO/xanthine dehydrogenase Mo-binding subunit